MIAVSRDKLPTSAVKLVSTAALAKDLVAPVGTLLPQALNAIRKGGIVVCGGIHMSDIPTFPYSILWEERSICSVANLTRRDGEEFMALAPIIPVCTQVETFRLEEANNVLSRLRAGKICGAAVLLNKP